MSVRFRPSRLMRFDSWHLGYTAHNGRLKVHYPNRDAAGNVTYAGGFLFDHEPEIARNPNGERATLWREMVMGETGP